ncbi:protein kinase [Candidatus Woesearchaeota archaeon]|jgi:hypothetical protein|nr:protein kinase [Candidatus Woesearchaeota archaeon]MBT5396681.1 protein kinase [Candidatus Woesearchaeota archaeon]MBT5924374.1 protein kinase [Candidatus Woesearchaeota archaeon]MBT6367532.1 protein kinase [Candidatus Woesearchaeota archaeon]MBT7763031.1 protein kinase [Candidatus Woesearchaeota archaeon]
MYIIERLKRIENFSERTITAGRLLYDFDNPVTSHFPKGCWDPVSDKWPSPQEVEREIATRRDFYTELKVVLRGNTFSQELGRRFEKESSRMRELTNMSAGKRTKQYNHTLPPFCCSLLHSLVYNSEGGKGLMDDFSVTEELLGSGGVADVYKGKRNYNPLAVKVFHPSCKIPLKNRKKKVKRIQRIHTNLQDKFGLLQSVHFARPSVVPDCHGPLWFAMEFCDGKDVRKIIKRKELDKEDKARVLITYSRMLKYLHDQDMVFVDNNWGSVMLGKHVKVIDYDCISRLSDLESPKHFARGMYQLHYASQEHFTGEVPGKESDVEAFCLMIDHLYHRRDPFIESTLESGQRNQNSASFNTRRYPQERKVLLPPQLGEVVSSQITYPRTEGITIDDVIAAIKDDFKIDVEETKKPREVKPFDYLKKEKKVKIKP